jgi:hypothetical protein
VLVAVLMALKGCRGSQAVERSRWPQDGKLLGRASPATRSRSPVGVVIAARGSFRVEVLHLLRSSAEYPSLAIMQGGRPEAGEKARAT